MASICLDHNATTPPLREAREEMIHCLDQVHGNPSSLHAAGQQARRWMDRARARIAGIIGATPEELVLTSGGTEANNLAIFGVVGAASPDRREVVTTAIEHQSVLQPVRALGQSGHRVTFLPVDAQGRIELETLQRAIGERTGLVSIMLANNDVGTLQPVREAARLCRASGIPVHTDAVQAVGKIPVDVRELEVDLLSFSAHKLQGPKGAGALYVRAGTRLASHLHGGRQERGLRPGTENVCALAGFGRACEVIAPRVRTDADRIAGQRERFERAILESVPGAHLNGHPALRLPNTAHLGFEGVDAEKLVIHLDLLGLMASTGSACSSSDRKPSHVLVAMGQTPEQALSSVRFSLGREHSEEELDRAVAIVREAVAILRGGSE